MYYEMEGNNKTTFNNMKEESDIALRQRLNTFLQCSTSTVRVFEYFNNTFWEREWVVEFVGMMKIN